MAVYSIVWFLKCNVCIIVFEISCHQLLCLPRLCLGPQTLHQKTNPFCELSSTAPLLKGLFWARLCRNSSLWTGRWALHTQKHIIALIYKQDPSWSSASAWNRRCTNQRCVAGLLNANNKTKTSKLILCEIISVWDYRLLEIKLN